MERIQRLAQPKIVEKMVEMQVEHDLPVEIIIGEEKDGLIDIICEYELIDYYAYAWLLNKAIQYFTQFPGEAIMACHD